MEVQLDWQHLEQLFDFNLQLDTQSPFSGVVQLEHQNQQDSSPSTAEIDFSLQDGYVNLSRINLTAVQQTLSGEGCFLFAEAPALHLRIQSQDLDVDAVQTLLPTSETESNGFEIDEPPIEINLLLEAKMAHYSGADVKDLRLLVGKEPDCAEITSQTP